MRIICPHCTTSYAIDLATLGAAGRTVRCSRCKEVWLARPEDATVAASVPAMAEAVENAGQVDAAAEWEALAREEDGGETPVVDSPSISSELPTSADGEAPVEVSHGAAVAQNPRPNRLPWLRNLFKRRARPVSRKSSISLPTACAAMGALVLALMIWRVDVVKLLPQTAMLYKMVGFDVNVRGITFKDVKITTETVEGKSILVIEGLISGETLKPVELPRLRFSVRDAQGTEIYAWNTALEQSVVKPGEKVWFKSRLASPPPEGRSIDVRFFSKRDIAGGSV